MLLFKPSISGGHYHIYRSCFQIWKKIGVRPCPLLQLLQEKDRSRFPRNNLNKSQKREIYNFWLKKVHSIQSVDCRPGPYKVKLSQKEYFKLYNNIQDQNVPEEKKALKSGENTYMTAQCKINVKPIYIMSSWLYHQDRAH